MAKYTNTRTGATRESGTKLGYPYVETAKISKGNGTKSGPTAEAPSTSDSSPTKPAKDAS